MHRPVERATRWRVVAATALGLSLGLAACGDDGSSSESATTADLSRVTLTIGVETSSFGDLAVRKASGAFEGTPYTLEFAEFDSTNLAVEALYGKAIDGIMDASPQATLLAQGNAEPAWTPRTVPFAITSVNVTVDRASGPQIIVRPDSGITSVQDLAGKKLAFTAGTLAHYYWIQQAQQAGLDITQVEQVKMASADVRAAFAAGDVDAIVTSYRQSLGVLAKGNAVVLPVLGEPLRSYRSLLARPDSLADPGRQAAFADFILRSERAESWIRTHPDQVAAIYAEEDKLDADTAAKVALAVRRQTIPLDASVLAEFQRQADVFLAQGVIKNPVDLTLVFDHRFDSIIPVS